MRNYQRNVIALAFLSSMSFSSVQAADKYWEYSTCGTDWWDQDCWSATFLGSLDGNGQPKDGDGVYLYNTGVSNIGVLYFNTAYPTATLNSLIINATDTGNMTFTQGGYNLQVLTEIVGDTGTGAFNQIGGTNAVTGTLSLGSSSSANGSYDLSGTGALSADSVYIGSSGTGTFIQTGGSNTMDSALYLGHNSTGNGSYDLSGGVVTGTIHEYIGYAGTGTFTQSGGTNTLLGGSLYLGYDSTGDGSYNLSSGDLSVVFEYIGRDGAGSFTQTGGTHTVAAPLYIGSSASGSGSYDLSGTGILSARTAYIGEYGTGTFTQSGGTSTIISSLFVGNGSTGNGNYNLSGGDLSAGTEYIGQFGTGNLTQTGGTNTVANVLIVGNTSSGNGSYDLSGGSLTVVGPYLTIGAVGTGSLNISNGGVASSMDAYLGYDVLGSGTVILSGTGSAWNNSGSMFVGGSDVFSGGIGDLTINSGATLNVGNTLHIWNTGNVHLDGGTINTGSLTGEGGGFNFNAGSLNITGDLVMDAMVPLGNSLVLNGFKTLNVSGITTLTGFSALMLDGGTFSTGSLLNNGGFAFNRGTFNLTNENLVIGSGGLFGSFVQFDYGQTVNVTNTTTVNTGSALALNNSVFTSGMMNNDGQILLNGLVSSLGGGIINNAGLLTGTGNVGATLNNASGEVRVITGDELIFTGTANYNNSQINLAGGTARFNEDLVNTLLGVINGRGTLVVDGGLTNQGSINLSSGTTDIHGNVSNTAGSSIIVSGNGTATFYDDMAHNGDEIRVSDGSNAVFFGTVSGSGAYTGTGTVFFEGTVLPGNSPGRVDVEGNLGLGVGSHTLMELGGLVRGDEYDAFAIGGNLFLDGELEVSLFDLGGGLFAPQLGDSFDLFSAEVINGNFDLLTLATLGGGLGWNLDFLTDEIGSLDIARLSVVSASTVPVPPAVWLFGSGLLGLVGVARRRKVT